LLSGVTLLGDHEGLRTARPRRQRAGQRRQDIVRHWPSPPEPIRGLSMNELLRDSRLHVARAPSRRRQLRELIGKVAGASGTGRGARRPMPAEIQIESPVPCADRRAMVSRALGGTPLLYRAPLQTRQSMPAQERVHIYVDVSGSMEGIKGIYGAVLDCSTRPSAGAPSRPMAEVTPAQLRAGICKSTGGTDIRCVTRHMARHRVRRAVLLTDGYVGAADAAGCETLGRARLGVAYIGAHISRDPLERHADASITLDLDA
jgi:hypothetical protein